MHFPRPQADRVNMNELVTTVRLSFTCDRISMSSHSDHCYYCRCRFACNNISFGRFAANYSSTTNNTARCEPDDAYPHSTTTLLTAWGRVPGASHG